MLGLGFYPIILYTAVYYIVVNSNIIVSQSVFCSDTTAAVDYTHAIFKSRDPNICSHVKTVYMLPTP